MADISLGVFHQWDRVFHQWDRVFHQWDTPPFQKGALTWGNAAEKNP